MQLQVQRLIGPWQPGDLDGFLALGLNNLIQILLIISLCRDAAGRIGEALTGGANQSDRHNAEVLNAGSSPVGCGSSVPARA